MENKIPEFPKVFTEEDEQLLAQVTAEKEKMQEAYGAHFAPDAWAQKSPVEKAARHIIQPLADFIPAIGRRLPPFTKGAAAPRRYELEEEYNRLDRLRLAQERAPEILDELYTLAMMGQPVLDDGRLRSMYQELSWFPEDWVSYIMQYNDALAKATPQQLRDGTFWDSTSPQSTVDYMEYFQTQMKTISPTQVMSSVAFSQDAEEIRTALISAYPPAEGTEISSEQYIEESFDRYAAKFKEYGLEFDSSNPAASFEELAAVILQAEGAPAHLYNEETNEYIMVRKTPAIPELDMPYPGIWMENPDTGEDEFLGFWNEEDNQFAPWNLATGHPYLTDFDLEMANRNWRINFLSAVARGVAGMWVSLAQVIGTQLPSAILSSARALGYALWVEGAFKDTWRGRRIGDVSPERQAEIDEIMRRIEAGEMPELTAEQQAQLDALRQPGTLIPPEVVKRMVELEPTERQRTIAAYNERLNRYEDWWDSWHPAAETHLEGVYRNIGTWWNEVLRENPVLYVPPEYDVSYSQRREAGEGRWEIISDVPWTANRIASGMASVGTMMATFALVLKATKNPTLAFTVSGALIGSAESKRISDMLIYEMEMDFDEAALYGTAAMVILGSMQQGGHVVGILRTAAPGLYTQITGKVVKEAVRSTWKHYGRDYARAVTETQLIETMVEMSVQAAGNVMLEYAGAIDDWKEGLGDVLVDVTISFLPISSVGGGRYVHHTNSKLSQQQADWIHAETQSLVNDGLQLAQAKEQAYQRFFATLEGQQVLQEITPEAKAAVEAERRAPDVIKESHRLEEMIVMQDVAIAETKAAIATQQKVVEAAKQRLNNPAIKRLETKFRKQAELDGAEGRLVQLRDALYEAQQRKKGFEGELEDVAYQVESQGLMTKQVWEKLADHPEARGMYLDKIGYRGHDRGELISSAWFELPLQVQVALEGDITPLAFTGRPQEVSDAVGVDQTPQIENQASLLRISAINEMLSERRAQANELRVQRDRAPIGQTAELDAQIGKLNSEITTLMNDRTQARTAWDTSNEAAGESYTVRPLSMQTIESTARLVEQVHNESGVGSTVHPVEGNLWGKPYYSVSPYKASEYRTSNIIPGKTVTAEQIAHFAMSNMHLLQNTDHSIGTWYVSAENHVEVDIVVTPQSLHAALDIAELGQQEAIFDLGRDNEIKVATRNKKTGKITSSILYKKPWRLRHYSAREGTNIISREHFGEGRPGSEKQFYEEYRSAFDRGEFQRRSYWVVDKKGKGVYEGTAPWMQSLPYYDVTLNFRIYDSTAAVKAEQSRVDAVYKQIVEQYKQKFGDAFEGLPQNQAEMKLQAIYEAGYEGVYVKDGGVIIFKDVQVRGDTQVLEVTPTAPAVEATAVADYSVTIEGETYSPAAYETTTSEAFETTNTSDWLTQDGEVVTDGLEVVTEGIEMPPEVQARFLGDARRELDTHTYETNIRNLRRASITDGEMLIRVDSKGEVVAMATILMREGTPTLSVVVADKSKGMSRGLALRDILRYVKENNVAMPPISEMSPEAIRIYQRLNQQAPLVRDMIQRQEKIKERLATKRIPLEERRTLGLEFRHNAAVLEVMEMETQGEAESAIHTLKMEIDALDQEIGYRNLPYHAGKRNIFPGWSTAQLHVTQQVYVDALESGVFGEGVNVYDRIGWASQAYSGWDTINFTGDTSTTNADVSQPGLPPMDRSPIMEDFQHDPDLKLARLPSLEAESAAVAMAVHAKGNEAIAEFIGEPARLGDIPNNSVSWLSQTSPIKKGLSIENWQYILGNMQAKFGQPFHRMFKRFRQAEGYGKEVNKDFHMTIQQDADLVQAFQTEEGMNRIRQIINAKGGFEVMPENVTMSEELAAGMMQQWLKNWIPRANIMAWEKSVENYGLDIDGIMDDLHIPKTDRATVERITDLHRKGLVANRDALLAQQTHWMIEGFTPWITVRPSLGKARHMLGRARGEDRLAHRYGVDMPTDLTFYQQLQLYNRQMSIQWALRNDLVAFKDMVAAISPKLTDASRGQMYAEMTQMINELQHLPPTPHWGAKAMLRFYSTIAPAVYHTNARLLLRNSLQGITKSPFRIDWLFRGMKGVPLDVQHKARMAYDFSTTQQGHIKTELEFNQYKPLWHRVPGYMGLHRLAIKLNLYGHSDNIPRARTSQTGVGRAWRAIEAYKKHGNVKKLLHDSGMDLFTKQQQNRFLEMVAVGEGQWNLGSNGLQNVTGYEAASFYMGESLADMVHYPYARWIRPPMEQGMEGRVLFNLVTFTREYWLRHVHHWQNVFDTSLPVNTRLANFRASASMILVGMIVSAYLRDIFGRHYRAYAPMDIMWFEVGGLMVGAARGLGELGSNLAVMMDMSQSEEERERAWGRLQRGVKNNAQLNVPFLRSFLSAVDAATGVEEFDAAMVSKLREWLDDNYTAEEIEVHELAIMERMRIALFQAPFPDMDRFVVAQKDLREREQEWLGTRDPMTGRTYTMSNYISDVRRLIKDAHIPHDMITEEAGFSELTLFAVEYLTLLDEFRKLPTYPTSVRRDWRNKNPDFELMLIFWEQYSSSQVAPGTVVFTSDYIDNEALARLLGSADGKAIVRAIEALDLYYGINPATMRSKFVDFRTSVFRGS